MEQKSKPSPKIIIETMLATGMTQAEAADHFGVSTRWIRTLQARYREGGINRLEPRSKRPRTNPRARSTPALSTAYLNCARTSQNAALTPEPIQFAGTCSKRESTHHQHHPQSTECSQTTVTSSPNHKSVLAAHGYDFKQINPTKHGKWTTVTGPSQVTSE